jgi:lysophospholipase L1-like esterase
MKRLQYPVTLVFVVFAAIAGIARAQTFESKPANPEFAKFKPLRAPSPGGLLLKKADRLAICGDSITEQKMYSRIMETYLTVCVPELEVTVRQYGWSGERAPGFLARMTNDCLRFNPTIATTCYGMNDHEYRPYEPRIGDTYREKSAAIIEAFKARGARVVHGSPGCVGTMPGWVKSASGTVEDLNLNLCELRNIGIDLAAREEVRFADIFWPMLTSGVAAQQRHGREYAVAGKDGVHPGWAGQVVMAYAFLKSLGLDGEIGTVTADFKAQKATASGGHTLTDFQNGEITLKSSRYPFCATGEPDNDNSIRSGMALVPFNEDLNRFVLVVKNAPAARCKVTWGAQSRSYGSEQLAMGVNLAADFSVNPFSDAFNRVDAAVGAKQEYETRQIKTLFHGLEGRADMETTAALTEKARAPLAAAIRRAMTPVTHAIRIVAE